MRKNIPHSAQMISVYSWEHCLTNRFNLNKGDPRECYVVFPDSGYIPEILKLIEDPSGWVYTCI